MTSAIFWQTIRNRRLSWLVYSGIGLLFLFLYLGTFPAVQALSGDYNKILTSMPKGVLEAFNITQSSPSFMGYLASKHYGFTWGLMIILLMISYAGGALAKEIDTRSMGLLLSLPVSRLRLYLIRLVAGVYGLAWFILLSELVVWPLAKIFNYSAPASDVINIGILGFYFGLAILGLGMMFSALVSESGKASGAMTGVLLVMYVLNIVAQLEDKLKSAQYVSLFHYFSPGKLVDGGQLDVVGLSILLGVALVAAAIGAWAFVRRDISV